MAVKISKKKEESRGFLWHKLTYVMYVVILIVAVVVLYFAVWQYVKYQNLFSYDDRIDIVVVENDVDAFQDRMVPYVIFRIESTGYGHVDVLVESEGYSTAYSSKRPVKEYTKTVTLPEELFGKDLNITAVAKDKKGMRITVQETVKLKEQPDVLFKIG